MLDQLTRQAAALIIALCVFLNGAAPACAMPASDGNSMPGMTMLMQDMTMDQSCMDMGKAATDKHAPSKGSESSCAMCTSCATSIVLVLDLVPVPNLHERNGK